MKDESVYYIHCTNSVSSASLDIQNCWNDQNQEIWKKIEKSWNSEDDQIEIEAGWVKN